MEGGSLIELSSGQQSKFTDPSRFPDLTYSATGGIKYPTLQKCQYSISTTLLDIDW